MARAAETTRRALLATAAGLAGGVTIRAAALPALAAEADPIFALIDEHRRLWQAYVTACQTSDDDDDSVNCIAADAVAERIMATIPTTAAGAAALLAYVAANLYGDDGEGTTVFTDDDFEDDEGRFAGGRSFVWWIMHNCAEALARIT